MNSSGQSFIQMIPETDPFFILLRRLFAARRAHTQRSCVFGGVAAKAMQQKPISRTEHFPGPKRTEKKEQAVGR